MYILRLLVSLVALALTTIVLLVHYSNKAGINATVLLSLNIGTVLILSLFTNSEEISQYSHDPMCIFQGAATNFVMLSTSFSMVRLVTDIYNIISGKAESDNHIRRRQFVTLGFCIGLPLIMILCLNTFERAHLVSQWYCIITMDIQRYLIYRVILFTIVFGGSVMTGITNTNH